jgi:hypothetical protein
MILKVFSIFDSKVGAYMKPVFVISKGEIIRSFQEAVNDKSGNSNLAKYPQDFTLFEIGEFDDSSAAFNLHATPLSIGVGVEFLNKDVDVLDQLDKSSDLSVAQ